MTLAAISGPPQQLSDTPPPDYSPPATSASTLPILTTTNIHSSDDIPPADAASALHPRVAVILGVRKVWHPFLQLCRGLSIAPALWWFFKCLWIFLQKLPFIFSSDGTLNGFDLQSMVKWSLEERIEVSEIALSVVWCYASAHLNFVFTDCLMSRWLLNYTPLATVVRLMAIDSLNMYLCSLTVALSRADLYHGRYLWVWIGISSALTILYRILHHNVNIKRETRLANRLFYICSIITMATVLLIIHFPLPRPKSVPSNRLNEKTLPWKIVSI